MNRDSRIKFDRDVRKTIVNLDIRVIQSHDPSFLRHVTYVICLSVSVNERRRRRRRRMPIVFRVHAFNMLEYVPKFRESCTNSAAPD